MKKLLLILVILTSTLYVNSQTNNYPAFSKIETLLKNVEGAEFIDRGSYFKIIKQSFEHNKVSIITKRISDGVTFETVYTDIYWPKKISKTNLSFWGHPSDGQMFVFITLDKDLRQKNFRNGELIDDFSEGKKILIYFFPKDKEALIELFGKLLK